MRAAGIRQFGGAVEALQLPEPAAPRSDEVLIAVHAAGVGNWDEYVRDGSWDTGIRPPMALGVEAAGVVIAVGGAVGDLAVGASVTTHSVPLRNQGSWAEEFIVPASHVAPVPPGTPADVAGAAPIPLLTADQALTDAARIEAGQTVLVHGAGGVTGGVLVQLAVHYGARVIATASAHSADRVLEFGAASVVDYRQPDWEERVRALTGGVDAAVNAVRGGAADAFGVVRDGGRLVTITGDPPSASRGIAVAEVQVIPNGPRLARLARLLSEGVVGLAVGARYGLAEAAVALEQARHGAHGAAIVLCRD